jgi:hypothetical protein
VPAKHVIVEHFAAFEQQRAAVVPTVLYLAVSLYLPTVHDTTFPPHLATSVTQQVLALSAVVQDPPVQYVVAAAAICFLPAAHVTDEHFALLEQHAASVLPVVPYLSGSLNLLVPQVTVAPKHLRVSVIQQVASSALPHTPFAQYVVDARVILFLPAGQM